MTFFQSKNSNNQHELDSLKRLNADLELDLRQSRLEVEQQHEKKVTALETSAAEVQQSRQQANETMQKMRLEINEGKMRYGIPMATFLRKIDVLRIRMNSL